MRSGERAAALPRRPGRDDHKYSRGVLGLRTGSNRYPGAAVLGATAAWRTGIGLLRYAPPLDDRPSDHALPSPAAAVLAARPETVFGAPAPGGRGCDAWVIGSGTDPDTRSSAERDALLGLLTGTAPVIVDAGALGLVIDVVGDGGRLAPVLLTPHAGEFAGLCEAAGLDPLPGAPDARAREAAVVALAAALGAAVLLKGSETICAAADGTVRRHGPATPWLATAGTGDVLAGVLGALAAAHSDGVRADPPSLVDIGETGALLHDRAARLAAGDPEAAGAGRPITASDVAEALPRAVESLTAPPA